MSIEREFMVCHFSKRPFKKVVQSQKKPLEIKKPLELSHRKIRLFFGTVWKNYPANSSGVPIY